MSENIIDKALHLCGGANTSSSATFRSDKKESKMMSLLRRIKEYCHVMTNKPLCHPELFDKGNKRKFELCEPVPRVAGSQGQEILNQVQNDNVFNTLSYRAKEVRCGIFKNLKKAFAFTLAETLIVMGIIGVVAALTIPNLNSSTADKEKVAKLKKVYSNLNDAIGRAEAVYGPLSEWDIFSTGSNGGETSTKPAERLADFLKVSKTCKTSLGCFASSNYKKLDGTSVSLASSDINHANSYYSFILADGTSLGIQAACSIMTLFVDIDGPNKGSSTLGKDLFMFYVLSSSYSTSNSSYPMWQLVSDNPAGGKSLPELSNITSNFKTGEGLATWVLQNDNMDYLKATNGTCKNGKVLSWTNTSCK